LAVKEGRKNNEKQRTCQRVGKLVDTPRLRHLSTISSLQLGECVKREGKRGEEGRGGIKLIHLV
jgi:hypothetical protein